MSQCFLVLQINRISRPSKTCPRLDNWPATGHQPQQMNFGHASEQHRRTYKATTADPTTADPLSPESFIKMTANSTYKVQWCMIVLKPHGLPDVQWHIIQELKLYVLRENQVRPIQDWGAALPWCTTVGSAGDECIHFPELVISSGSMENVTDTAEVQPSHYTSFCHTLTSYQQTLQMCSRPCSTARHCHKTDTSMEAVKVVQDKLQTRDISDQLVSMRPAFGNEREEEEEEEEEEHFAYVNPVGGHGRSVRHLYLDSLSRRAGEGVYAVTEVPVLGYPSCGLMLAWKSICVEGPIDMAVRKSTMRRRNKIDGVEGMDKVDYQLRGATDHVPGMEGSHSEPVHDTDQQHFGLISAHKPFSDESAIPASIIHDATNSATTAALSAEVQCQSNLLLCNSTQDLEPTDQHLWTHLLQDNIRLLLDYLPDSVSALAHTSSVLYAAENSCCSSCQSLALAKATKTQGNLTHMCTSSMHTQFLHVVPIFTLKSVLHVHSIPPQLSPCPVSSQCSSPSSALTHTSRVCVSPGEGKDEVGHPGPCITEAGSRCQLQPVRTSRLLTQGPVLEGQPIPRRRGVVGGGTSRAHPYPPTRADNTCPTAQRGRRGQVIITEQYGEAVGASRVQLAEPISMTSYQEVCPVDHLPGVSHADIAKLHTPHQQRKQKNTEQGANQEITRPANYISPPMLRIQGNTQTCNPGHAVIHVTNKEGNSGRVSLRISKDIGCEVQENNMAMLMQENSTIKIRNVIAFASKKLSMNERSNLLLASVLAVLGDGREVLGIGALEVCDVAEYCCSRSSSSARVVARALRDMMQNSPFQFSDALLQKLWFAMPRRSSAGFVRKGADGKRAEFTAVVIGDAAERNTAARSRSAHWLSESGVRPASYLVAKRATLCSSLLVPCLILNCREWYNFPELKVRTTDTSLPRLVLPGNILANASSSASEDPPLLRADQKHWSHTITGCEFPNQCQAVTPKQIPPQAPRCSGRDITPVYLLSLIRGSVASGRGQSGLAIILSTLWWLFKTVKSLATASRKAVEKLASSLNSSTQVLGEDCRNNSCGNNSRGPPRSALYSEAARVMVVTGEGMRCPSELKSFTCIRHFWQEYHLQPTDNVPMYISIKKWDRRLQETERLLSMMGHNTKCPVSESLVDVTHMSFLQSHQEVNTTSKVGVTVTSFNNT
ncbi:hypothetical protein PR048_011960 [Dryococelus australis]|uniref:Uncharacterized protein n=1 Tax=Dryococelus australis TaxID=614101 RepID=A0ABQ9HNK1_9NEOP|nr:hypothetical protein PR048_011960 [Dryococelus australis]